MQDQALIKSALELHEMGKSIRQIAGELKTSKSTVFRWLNGQSGNGGNALPIDLFAIATNTQQSINQKNKYDMENNNEFNKFEREIALKRLQLEHELELRKLVQQDRELELRKRELELKHLEKDAISRQQQIEERKINHGLKVWIQKERANLEEVDDEEIEMDLATFKRHHKVLKKLWEQVQQHVAVYGIDTESHMGYDNLKSLIEMLNEELENAMEEKDEDDEDSDITVSYEYDDDSIEFIENLENSDFFS